MINVLAIDNTDQIKTVLLGLKANAIAING